MHRWLRIFQGRKNKKECHARESGHPLNCLDSRFRGNDNVCRNDNVCGNDSEMTQGFTMIETLVVATIFSIIALGLGAAFISGMKIWDKARNWTFDRTVFMLDLETISTDLRQSVNSVTIGFEGDSKEMSFPMLSGNSIVRVTYSFDAEAKELLRRQIDIKYISESEKEQEEKYIEKKFPAWEDFSLSYLYYDTEKEAYVWGETWAKEKGIFTAVKLEANFKGEQFIKTVFKGL